jgi:hypothetical protein
MLDLNKYVRCEARSDKARIKTIVCVYNCEKCDKIKCLFYTNNYEDFKSAEIDPFFINKYGEPSFPLPKALMPKLKKRKKRENNGCAKHPTYTGKKITKNDCPTCKDIYQKYQNELRSKILEEGKCPDHPNYRGLKKTNTGCSICQGIYEKKQKELGKLEVKPAKVKKEVDVCPEHPKNRGLRRPRNGCKTCMDIYLKNKS